MNKEEFSNKGGKYGPRDGAPFSGEVLYILGTPPVSKGGPLSMIGRVVGNGAVSSVAITQFGFRTLVNSYSPASIALAKH